MATSKKLYNQVETLVDESLVGFAASHQNVRKLQNHRVLVRADVDEFKKLGKFAIVSGGGSGHEPMFAGFVGRGGLTASIAGSVFTSPPPSQILAALTTVQNPSGILVFIINYTGDRLNFGIAIERFSLQFPAIPIRTVVVAEDCALTSCDKSAGRRGLAGAAFAIKIAGSMSESGVLLNDAADKLKIVVENLGTIGLSLSSCSLPGRSYIFSLGASEMELGLGVHGEPGVARLPLKGASESVDTMLCHLSNFQSATHMQLNEGDEIAVLMNNLGGLTNLELNLLCKEVLEWFERKNIEVTRFYVGVFMTSLEMQGFSISILRMVCKDWYQHLDDESDCSSWPRYEKVVDSFSVDSSEMECSIQTLSSTFETNNVVNDKNDVYKCLLGVCEMLIGNERFLNDLDQACGDGDCGTTMKNGAAAIKANLINSKLPVNSLGKLAQQMSELWESNTGGTAGALYSLFLSSASKSLTQNSSGIGCLRALIQGTETIRKYGGAQPGDRTMVDSLAAASDVAQRVIESSQVIDKEFLERLLEAVESASSNTKSMVAKAGRASYVAKSNLTKPDPGAVGVFLWIKAICDYYLNVV